VSAKRRVHVVVRRPVHVSSIMNNQSRKSNEILYDGRKSLQLTGKP
jgi:hypothetical protein